MSIDVLVIGGGGREHALIKALRRSPRLGRLYCAPGNAGIGRDAELLDIPGDDLEALADFAEANQVDLTVVGPEAPLVAGIADIFRARNLRIFGPEREAALLEGSKAFAKEVMASAGIPTAEAFLFEEHEAALRFLGEREGPVVVKADGLAAGKGVSVCRTRQEAEEALDEIFRQRRFGPAGDRVLIEEVLEGEELSLLAIVSGEQILPLAPAQDYKRIFDLDEGPNTGGMGSYSPVPGVNAEAEESIVNTILKPVVTELGLRGIGFRGVLYAGLMLTDEGPKVLEFNCRFGDPETQALLPRLRSDLLEILDAAARGQELPARAEWEEGACVSVVMASKGYPASSSKGDVIRGLEDAEAEDGVSVFHAGTAWSGDEVVTDGGRVLAVSAVAPSFAAARERAYAAVGKIYFEGAQFRMDIALRAEEREAARQPRRHDDGSAGPGTGR